MTIQTDRVQEIFQDALFLQAAAVDRLDQGDIRDAAEKAWGATKRATDALILARTGEEPERAPETGAETPDHLTHPRTHRVRRCPHDPRRYYTRQGRASRPDASTTVSAIPLEETERQDQPRPADYIEDAQRLAGIA